MKPAFIYREPKLLSQVNLIAYKENYTNTKEQKQIFYNHSMSKRLVALSTLVILLTGALVAQDKLPHTPIDTRLKVIDVIDGDTFITANGARIRLYAANSPELTNCYGPESKKYLSSLILNKKVTLLEPRGDAYGRVMALVYVGDKLVNLDLIKNGYTRYVGQVSSQSKLLQEANTYARQNKLGIYSSQCLQVTNPKNPKCNIKGNINDAKKTYFLPACWDYNNVALELDQGDQWFCTEAEAISAGFSPSAHCPK